ncbi:hypothetical protein EUX98_g9315, partial [Antrodiella citrinella]
MASTSASASTSAATQIWTRTAIFRSNEANRSACTPEHRQQLLVLYDVVAIIKGKRVDNVAVGMHPLCKQSTLSLAASNVYGPENEAWNVWYVQSGTYSSQIRSLLPNAQWGIMRLLAYRYHQVREILNLDWPINSYTSNVYRMARIEGNYLHKVMEAVKKEMKSRTRAPNTRLTVLDAWMFFEILTKNNLENLGTVLQENSFSNQTVVLEDMEELDAYLHRGEIADPTWWHKMDTRTAEEWWENMTAAGWVTGNQPAKHDDAAWRSVPPLQQGLHSTRDVDKDGTEFTYAFGPKLSHVVRQYRDTVLIRFHKQASAQPSNADASGSQQDFNKEPPKTRRKNESDDNDNEEQEEQIQGRGEGKQRAAVTPIAKQRSPAVTN